MFIIPVILLVLISKKYFDKMSKLFFLEFNNIKTTNKMQCFSNKLCIGSFLILGVVIVVLFFMGDSKMNNLGKFVFMFVIILFSIIAILITNLVLLGKELELMYSRLFNILRQDLIGIESPLKKLTFRDITQRDIWDKFNINYKNAKFEFQSFIGYGRIAGGTSGYLVIVKKEITDYKRGALKKLANVLETEFEEFGVVGETRKYKNTIQVKFPLVYKYRAIRLINIDNIYRILDLMYNL